MPSFTRSNTAGKAGKFIIRILFSYLLYFVLVLEILHREFQIIKQILVLLITSSYTNSIKS